MVRPTGLDRRFERLPIGSVPPIGRAAGEIAELKHRCRDRSSRGSDLYKDYRRCKPRRGSQFHLDRRLFRRRCARRENLPLSRAESGSRQYSHRAPARCLINSRELALTGWPTSAEGVPWIGVWPAGHAIARRFRTQSPNRSASSETSSCKWTHSGNTAMPIFYNSGVSPCKRTIPRLT